MGPRTFSNAPWLRKSGKQLAVSCLLCFAAACAGDHVTRPDVTTPDSTPPHPTPRQMGNLVARVFTNGTDLDADGYVLKITAADSLRTRRVAGTDSVTIDHMAVGAVTVVLTDLAANCWVTLGRYRSDSIRANGLTTVSFAVDCASMSGELVSPGALVGVWEARNYEFFGDANLTSPIEDVVADGLAGTLTVGTHGGTEIQWKWRETYRWWGPDRPTVVTGHAEVSGASLISVVDDIVTEFECDWGDCWGPLHGEHRLVLNDNILVITRRESVEFSDLIGSYSGRAWPRLVLEKVQ